MYEQILERSSFSLRLWRTFSGLCAPGTPAEPCQGGEIWTYASSEAGAVWVSWGAELSRPSFNTSDKFFRGFFVYSISFTPHVKRGNSTTLALEPWLRRTAEAAATEAADLMQRSEAQLEAITRDNRNLHAFADASVSVVDKLFRSAPVAVLAADMRSEVEARVALE